MLVCFVPHDLHWAKRDLADAEPWIEDMAVVPQTGDFIIYSKMRFPKHYRAHKWSRRVVWRIVEHKHVFVPDMNMVIIKVERDETYRGIADMLDDALGTFDKSIRSIDGESTA